MDGMLFHQQALITLTKRIDNKRNFLVIETEHFKDPAAHRKAGQQCLTKNMGDAEIHQFVGMPPVSGACDYFQVWKVRNDRLGNFYRRLDVVDGENK